MFDTETVKPLLASRTVWGGIVSLLVAVLALCGISLDADMQAQLVDAALGIGASVAGGLTIWGRIRARTAIKPVGTKAARGAKALLLFALLLPVLSVTTGCALKNLQPHEQAMAVGEELRITYVALHHEYLQLHEALPDARPTLEADVAPLLDDGKRAVVALREAATLWARTQQQPGDWLALKTSAMRLLGDAAALLQAFTREG